MVPSANLDFASAGVTPRPYRPVLVSLACAATELGLEADTVKELTEAGKFRFVFDLAAKGAKRRELRFWLGELRGEPGAAAQTLEGALHEIAGPKALERVRTATVSGRLQTTRTVVHKWLDSGEIAGGTAAGGRQWISRASLVEFLRRRLAV
jgi:hypothetical protein